MQSSRTDQLSADSAGVADELRKLPPVTPMRSGWADIARELDRQDGRAPGQSKKAWWFGGLGVAFGFALALFVSTQMMQQQPEVDLELATLIAYSQMLEAELNRIRPMSTVYGGHQAAAIAEIEDHIALVDLQLAGAPDASSTQQLWGQRVSLMSDLVSVHSAQVVNTRL